MAARPPSKYLLCSEVPTPFCGSWGICFFSWNKQTLALLVSLVPEPLVGGSKSQKQYYNYSLPVLPWIQKMLKHKSIFLHKKATTWKSWSIKHSISMVYLHIYWFTPKTTQFCSETWICFFNAWKKSSKHNLPNGGETVKDGYLPRWKVVKTKCTPPKKKIQVNMWNIPIGPMMEMVHLPTGVVDFWW